MFKTYKTRTENTIEIIRQVAGVKIIIKVVASNMLLQEEVLGLLIVGFVFGSLVKNK